MVEQPVPSGPAAHHRQVVRAIERHERGTRLVGAAQRALQRAKHLGLGRPVAPVRRHPPARERSVPGALDDENGRGDDLVQRHPRDVGALTRRRDRDRAVRERRLDVDHAEARRDAPCRPTGATVGTVTTTTNLHERNA